MKEDVNNQQIRLSKSERRFIQDVLCGNADRYSPSYASRLRGRIMTKATMMGEDLASIHRMFLHDYKKIVRYGLDDLSSRYLSSLRQVQSLPLIPALAKFKRQEDADDES